MAKQDKKERGAEGKIGKRRLFLLRHAKAVLGGDDIDDLPRALAERGHQQISRLIEELAEKKFAPDLALVSPSTRTQQTFDLLRAKFGDAGLEIRDDLYLAPAARLLEIARSVDDRFRDVLIVGHNPGLHDLATMLMAPESAFDKPKSTRRLMLGFPTGSLAEFEFLGRWSELAPGSAKLKRFLRPKDLLPAVAA